MAREAAKGKQSGRTQEIQRLIGRSLRAVVDRAAMGEMTVTLDCDVLNADGGTRCAAITGAWVALSLAFQHLKRMNVLKADPLTGQVAAVSCGIADGQALRIVDLHQAFVDHAGDFVDAVALGHGRQHLLDDRQRQLARVLAHRFDALALGHLDLGETGGTPRPAYA